MAEKQKARSNTWEEANRAMNELFQIQERSDAAKQYPTITDPLYQEVIPTLAKLGIFDRFQNKAYMVNARKSKNIEDRRGKELTVFDHVLGFGDQVLTGWQAMGRDAGILPRPERQQFAGMDEQLAAMQRTFDEIPQHEKIFNLVRNLALSVAQQKNR